MLKKYFIACTLLAGMLVASCSTDLYDYDELNDRMDIFDERLSELENWCKETNTNINSLKSLVESLIQHDVITAVTPVLNENKVTGYTITFLNAEPITIYHGENGKDGADGEDGKDGQNGTDGEDGKDGQDGTDGRTPLIGVKQDTDGIYYWTLNGDWLLDNEQKIKVHGADGTNGITPQLKIENGFWHVSYDNGETWTQMSDENAVSGNNVFKSVTVNEGNITFVLNDDDETELVVPVYQEIGITFNMKNNVSGIAANEVIYIPYTLTNATDKTKVTVSSDGSYKAEVKDPTKDGGEIVVTAPGVYVDGFVNVHIDSGCGYSSFYVINFYKQEMTFKNGLEYNVKPEGETIAVPLTTNFDYTVSIPTEAQEWVSLADSRVTERNETLTFTFDKNENLYAGRSVSVGIIADNAKEPLYYITFNQASAHYSIDKSRFAAPSGGGEFIANVTSTLGLKATDYPDWIVPTIELKENETTKYKLTLKVAGNTSGAYRTATVKLVSDDGEQLGKVEVSQLAIEVSEMNKMIIEVSANPANKFTTVLPLDGTVQCEIDWGDGSKSEVVTSKLPTHTYETGGEAKHYEVKISGVVTRLNSYNIEDTYRNSIYAIKRWGKTGLTNMSHAFYGCNNLRTVVADDSEAFEMVTTFESCFNNCIRLETLFPNLFAYARNATSFQGAFFGCVGLKEVPATLFNNCKNVTTFKETFNTTSLTSVPEELFSSCTEVTTFESVFAHCEDLYTVPSDLFKNNTKVTSFENAFYSSGIQEVPEDLFALCTKVKTFSSLFAACDNLTEVPAGLFRNCPDVSSFSGTFAWCYKLQSVPVGIFDGNRRVVSFNIVFMNCFKISGESPYTEIGGVRYHLYERINNPEEFITPTSYGTALGDSNWTDKDNIPISWK